MSYEEPEELEELEELKELSGIEEYERPEAVSGPADFALLALPCVRVWQASYENSSVPFAVLDSKLRIIWTNDIYTEHLGRGEKLNRRLFYENFLPGKKPAPNRRHV